MSNPRLCVVFGLFCFFEGNLIQCDLHVRNAVKLLKVFSFFFSLVIRGDKDERAVLCSGDKTYDLKIADTSNLLMFVPGCRTPDQLTDGQNSPHVVHTQVYNHTCANASCVYCNTNTATTSIVFVCETAHLD